MKRKILIIQHYGKLSGSIVGLLKTVEMLVENDYDLTLYLPMIENDVYNKFLELGAIVKPLMKGFTEWNYFSGCDAKLLSRTFLSPLFRIIKSSRWLNGVIDDEKPDIIICNSVVLSWVQMTKKHNNCKYYCHVRETIPEAKNIRRFVTRRNLQKFDGVMFITQRDMDDLNLDCPTCVVRDSLDKHIDELAKRLNQPKDCFSVGYVGGSNPIKGLDILLDSIVLLDFKVEVHIAGALTNEDIDKLISIQKNKPNIYFIVEGVLNNIYELLHECHILVCPSTVPHQLRPIFEAGYVGIPVVTTEFKEIRENLVDNYNGLTIPSRDSIALAKAIELLKTYDEYREELGYNNHIMSIKNTYENVSKELLKFIRN